MDITFPIPYKMVPGFPCTICSKVFDNRKSQTRHSSYCRKRSRNPPASRKKSCLICCKAKTQCDAKVPKCSRCLRKNLTCVYEGTRAVHSSSISTPEGSEEKDEHHVLSSLDASGDIPSSAFPSTNSSLDQFFNDSPISDITEFVTSHSPPLQSPRWDISRLNSTDQPNVLPYIKETVIGIQKEFQNSVIFPRLPAPGYKPQNTLMSASSPTSSTTARWELPSDSGLNDLNLDSLILDYLDYPSLTTEPILRPPRSFRPHRVRNHQLSLNRHFVICTLRSYPYMLLPGKNPPPFIHPQCLINISGDDRIQHKSLPGPLAKCVGIMNMWSVKNKENSGFIWDAIRVEQERLSSECFQYNDYNTVAALQAITIYFLLRLSEENGPATSFDTPLITTMLKIATRTRGFGTKYGGSTGIESHPTWQSWILAESLHRTITTLFLIDLLYEISPTPLHDCDRTTNSLTKLLLPAPKTLWHAPNETDWSAAYTNSESKKNCGLTYGDLIGFYGRGDEVSISTEGRVNPFVGWFEGVDEFGALVVAAAGLIS